MKFQNFDEFVTLNPVAYDSIDEGWTISVLSDEDFELDDLFGDDPETYSRHDGDVSIDGNVVFKAPDDGYEYVVLNGNLTISDTAIFCVWDMNRPIVVTGDLKAKNLVLSEEAHLYVLGSVEVENLMAAQFSDTGYCTVKGKTTAKTLVNGSGGDLIVDAEIERGVDADVLAERFPELAAVWTALENADFGI